MASAAASQAPVSASALSWAIAGAILGATAMWFVGTLQNLNSTSSSGKSIKKQAKSWPNNYDVKLHPDSSDDELMARLRKEHALGDSSDEEDGDELSTFPSQENEECKLVLVVRKDLGMGSGKIAAQCSHATLACYKHLDRNAGPNNPLLRRWEKLGQAKIAVQCHSEEQLMTLQATAMSLGLCARVIHDAGRTQIAAGSATVLGVGPGPKSIIDQSGRDIDYADKVLYSYQNGVCNPSKVVPCQAQEIHKLRDRHNGTCNHYLEKLDPYFAEDLCGTDVDNKKSWLIKCSGILNYVKAQKLRLDEKEMHDLMSKDLENITACDYKGPGPPRASEKHPVAYELAVWWCLVGNDARVLFRMAELYRNARKVIEATKRPGVYTVQGPEGFWLPEIESETVDLVTNKIVMINPFSPPPSRQASYLQKGAKRRKLRSKLRVRFALPGLDPAQSFSTNDYVPQHASMPFRGPNFARPPDIRRSTLQRAQFLQVPPKAPVVVQQSFTARIIRDPNTLILVRALFQPKCVRPMAITRSPNGGSRATIPYLQDGAQHSFGLHSSFRFDDVWNMPPGPSEEYLGRELMSQRYRGQMKGRWYVHKDFWLIER